MKYIENSLAVFFLHSLNFELVCIDCRESFQHVFRNSSFIIEKKKLWFRYGGDLSDGGLKASAHMPITTGVVTQECEAHQDGEADGDLRPDHHTSSSSCLHRFSLCSSCKTTILFSSSSVSSRLVIFCRLCKLTTVPLGTQNLPQGVQRP
jgi:hypothetical protein